MTEYLAVDDVLEIQALIIDRIGGVHGVRDRVALESAVCQPSASFGGEDLYASITKKAAALCFSIVKNHPFLDGNKRTGYVAMRTFLKLNGYDLAGRTDEKQQIILSLASGDMTCPEFETWLGERIYPRELAEGNEGQ